MKTSGIKPRSNTITYTADPTVQGFTVFKASFKNKQKPKTKNKNIRGIYSRKQRKPDAEKEGANRSTTSPQPRSSRRLCQPSSAGPLGPSPPPSLPPSFPASLLPSLRVGKPGHPTRPPAAPEPRRQLPGPQQGGPGLPAHTGRSSPGTAAPTARGGPRAAPASEAPEDLLRNAPALKGVCFLVCCRLCRCTKRWCRTGDLKTRIK